MISSIVSVSACANCVESGCFCSIDSVVFAVDSAVCVESLVDFCANCALFASIFARYSSITLFSNAIFAGVSHLP